MARPVFRPPAAIDVTVFASAVDDVVERLPRRRPPWAREDEDDVDPELIACD